MSDWARCNHLAHNEEDSYRLLSRLHTHSETFSVLYVQVSSFVFAADAQFFIKTDSIQHELLFGKERAISDGPGILPSITRWKQHPVSVQTQWKQQDRFTSTQPCVFLFFSSNLFGEG